MFHSIRTQLAQSGFNRDEPLLWGERTQSGWSVFFNREGVVTAWANRWNTACRFSLEITFDRSHYLRGRPGFCLHAWFWRYHAALYIGARRTGAISRKAQRRARRTGTLTNNSSFIH